MDFEEPRALLARLAAQRGDDLSALSRLLGRNPAYVQQFIKRGSPKRLDERDRRTLATYYGIDERLLGAPDAPPSATKAAALVPVARRDVSASAGHGSLSDDGAAVDALAFPPRWLKKRGMRADALSLITVTGTSMQPTLQDGDMILVEEGARFTRDGLYVLRHDGVLMVKRLLRGADGRVTVRSDNPDYPSWEAQSSDAIAVVGKVRWFGRDV